jgi:Enoyl-CoA hydratase/isomerase
MRKPVLASVQGHALGAGCELAMFCDLTITADDAMSGEHRPLQSTLANKSKILGSLYSLAVHCRRRADASRAIMILSAALPVTRSA